MFLKSGDEHEQRRIDFHHPLHHRKSVETGHLDVEEDEIGLLRLDRADRFAPVLAGVDHFDVLERFQANLEALNGEFLVVDDERADGHAGEAFSEGRAVTDEGGIGCRACGLEEDFMGNAALSSAAS